LAESESAPGLGYALVTFRVEQPASGTWRRTALVQAG